MIDRKALAQKWAPVLEHADLPKISDAYRREVTAVLLENQQREMSKSNQLNEDAPANSVGGFPDSGGVAKFDPVLISLVRRSMPKLIAYDVAGVQPLTQPTGLIFAMKSKYAAQNGAEALFNESNTEFTGKNEAGDQAAYDFADAATNVVGRGMSTAEGEALGTGGANPDFNQMAFSIEKIAVEAKTRKLKAEYSLELAQDMKAVHGIDAEAELSNILSTEILSEINREIIRTIYQTAKRGAVAGTTATAGTFDLDVDANGRWSVEKFKGLMFQIEREANAIDQQTRRGRGNFIICSADVASALQMAGVLDYTPALAANANLTVDDTSTTFAGILNGKYKVYIDPYTGNGGANPQYFVMGYKGSSSTDAGLFYAPYVPLQMMRAVDPNSFQPKIAFQTRYGIVANPFSQGANAVTGALTADSNVYYRKCRVLNIL
jgi:hypothetical protein